MSLLQEALKRKEQDESQRQPEAKSAEKISSVSPAENDELGQRQSKTAAGLAETGSGASRFAEPAMHDKSPPATTLKLLNVNLSDAGQQAAEVKNTGNPLSFPPQSMPAAEQNQAAASQNILVAAEPPARSARSEASGRGEASEQAHPGRHKASLLWVIVAVIAVCFGLTIMAGIVFLFYRGGLPVKVKTVQQAAQVDKTAAVVAGETNISADRLIPKPESVSLAETKVNQSVAPAGTNKPVAAIAQTQITAVAQNATVNSVQKQAAGSAGNKPPPAKSSFFKPKQSSAALPATSWPALKLTGILRGTEKTESTAFINGKMINAGQTIADVTIVEIQADGVILKYGNEKKFLRVGAVSY